MGENKEKETENVKKTEEKKSNCLVITLLIILLLGVFFAFGYAIGGTKIITIVNDLSKNKGNKDNTSSNSESTTEKITFKESELEKYVNSIMPVSSNGPSAKIYNVNKVTASDLSAKEKIEYVGHLVYAKHTSSADYAYDIISEDDIKSIVEGVYGEGTYERATFNLGCGDYVFHRDDNKYYSQTGCGGITDTMAKNIVIDYKATESRLEITTAYAFTDSNNKVYKDYNKQTALADVTGEMNQVEEFLTDYIKNNKDKLNHIVYVFESKDGRNYYFKELTNNI